MVAYHNTAVRFVLISTLSALAQSQSHGLNEDGGSNVDGASIPERVDAGSLELVSNAQRNPNASRSVGFEPFVWTGDPTSNASSRDIEWTWSEYMT
jgi:hypothetical protein